MRPRHGSATTTPTSAGGAFAFVFWNDDLDDDRVLGQLRFLADTGVRGVVLSARVGLSRRIGYLTEEFFRIVTLAVDECARLGLQVVLYDEASYPSGSANGLVVAQDPQFAARCLVPLTQTVQGPCARSWRPSLGRSLTDRLIVVVAHEVHGDGTLGPGHTLAVESRGLVRLDLPAGDWRVVAVFETLSGGTIRGAHDDEDDGSASAPAAADLLNPAAVQAFLHLTHDRYAQALGDHLSTTVVAVFTDEPDLLGRGPRADAVPWTPGFADDVARDLGVGVEEVLRRLPLLWERSQSFSGDYHRSLQNRLHRVYYAAQSRWCEDHGISLTGHPATGDDLRTARTFHWPGQDTVWRWVLPGETSALHGPESTAPKVASSAAHGRGHGTAVAEVLGAYGWRLSLSEAKWLLDWYLVRGVTTLVLHAFFASVRGNRAYESEPDLGEFTSLRPHVPALVRYANRVADLYAGARVRAHVAVVTDPDHVGDGVAARLLTHQIDFSYVTPDDLSAALDGTLRVGDQEFRTVLVDLPAADLNDEPFDTMRRNGIAVHPADVDLAELRPAVTVSPPAPSLRLVELRRDGRTTILCVNEGEGALETELHTRELHVPGTGARWYDPFTDRRWAARVVEGRTRLRLEHRQTLALELDATAEPERPAELTLGRQVELDAWAGGFLSTLEGAHLTAVGQGDWTATHRWTSGTAVFDHVVDLPDGVRDLVLDLGDVGEAATVVWNGVPVAELPWPPYRTTVPRELARPGTNRLQVHVSNSPANHYEGAELPSGLIGPVVLSY